MQQEAVFDARTTMGALYAGCMASVGLSAVLGVQTFLYFMIFHQDNMRLKVLVAWIWANDTAHTISIGVAIWQYGVLNFTQPAYLFNIAPCATVAITGISTLNANIFYGWRIHEMSKGNLWFTIPIAIFCVARIGMIICGTWEVISHRYESILVGSLAVSALTDIFIASTRYSFLRELKQGYMGVPEMVDAVVIFTINDGLLTCGVVVASIICFAAMPHTFIWVAIYFTLSKLYSNSILATLNLRNWYRHRNRPYLGPQIDHVARAAARRRAESTAELTAKGASLTKSRRSSGAGDFLDLDEIQSVQVFVDQRVDYTVRALGRDEGRAQARAEFVPRIP
ncbi:hypothetical protein C8F01DRAFT_1176785 [Mycena amicta]|nr:hypothetical protein C8F01DRAFT_1176785 [Mycena amicta]